MTQQMIVITSYSIHYTKLYEEASKLQGMQDLKFGDDNFTLSQGRSFEALGNAVNVTIIKHIVKKLLKL